MARWGLGPIFAFDCLMTSRRWQVYAGRSLLVTCLLAGLALVWITRFQGQEFRTSRTTAAVGEAFFDATMAVELVLALVVVPAATAGAICQDKMRGNLTLTLVTDLSDAEIVLGKLAARLVTVLGVIACSLPVLAIATSLGGVDPLATLGGMLVILGVAVLGIAVALTFSVWATKPHEALMATYASWAVWLLALLAWGETSPGTTPALLYASNPFWLLFGFRWFNPTASRSPVYPVAFLAGCLAISTVVVAVSVRRIRAVTLRQASQAAGRSASRCAPDRAWWCRLGLPAVSLDRDPVLWREWHRRQPSGWSRAIWSLYALLASTFTLLAIVANPGIAPGVGGFMTSIGLLMVSVTAATALAEERAHGSLDVLLTTPLSSRSIVLGKWWGSFRIIPRLAILPGVLVLGVGGSHRGLSEAIPIAVLVVALVLAYGAAITSLGLFFAARRRRLGQAVALTVGSYLVATVIYPTIALMVIRGGPDDSYSFWVSPFFGIYFPVVELVWRNGPGFGKACLALAVWSALISAFAYALLRVTLASFDRLLGRVPELPERPQPSPIAKPLAPKRTDPLSEWV